MGGSMPLYGDAYSPSIKHLSWIAPEANQPIQAPGGRKDMKLCMEYNRHSTLPKSMMNVCLMICYGDLKIDLKLQKGTKAMYFLIVGSAG